MISWFHHLPSNLSIFHLWRYTGAPVLCAGCSLVSSSFVLKHVHYLPLTFDPALTLQPWNEPFCDCEAGEHTGGGGGGGGGSEGAPDDGAKEVEGRRAVFIQQQQTKLTTDEDEDDDDASSPQQRWGCTS
jgi:hypothetical protein